MVFSSSLFLLIFLPFFLLIYFLLKAKFKNYFLLFASILFYSWGEPKFIFVILISTFLDFYIVKALYKTKSNLRKKIFLALSISTNLGLLLFFKYANFFVENINTVFGVLGIKEMKWATIALPIGISFYTFQTLTYSIDIYRGKHKPLEKVSDYMMYILMFPQLIAGPIVRFIEISDQIVDRKKFETIDNKILGFYRFVIGLAKKVLIANVMGAQADIVFGLSNNDLTTPLAWIGILAYAFQIYFDFAGYSDMAIGLGRMIGFNFPENFNSPYISQNISEFWRRWHMTLGNWMKDYLYIPLGGNKVKTKFRLYFNLWIVFLISGLWHGAAWNFVLWGAFHGFFLIMDRLFLIKALNKIGRYPSIIFTFFVTLIGWVLFRAESFEQIKYYLIKMFSINSSNTDVYLDKEFYTILIISIFFSFFTISKFGKQIEEKIFFAKEYKLKGLIIMGIISIILLVLSISSITASGFNPFIYFRF